MKKDAAITPSKFMSVEQDRNLNIASPPSEIERSIICHVISLERT